MPLYSTTQAGMLNMLKTINRSIYDFKLSRNKDDDSPILLFNFVIFLLLQQTNAKSVPMPVRMDQLF